MLTFTELLNCSKCQTKLFLYLSGLLSDDSDFRKRASFDFEIWFGTSINFPKRSYCTIIVKILLSKSPRIHRCFTQLDQKSKTKKYILVILNGNDQDAPFRIIFLILVSYESLLLTAVLLPFRNTICMFDDFLISMHCQGNLRLCCC